MSARIGKAAKFVCQRGRVLSVFTIWVRAQSAVSSRHHQRALGALRFRVGAI